MSKDKGNKSKKKAAKSAKRSGKLNIHTTGDE